MIINIFGVGRSGTKALQLFIAYALLQKHKQIKLNYEPYFWASRLQGIKHHLTTKHFTNSIEDFSASHQQFLKKISSGPVVVNKFIRANGRIEPISRITNADYNILIIRNKEGVLKSVNKEAFDFSSIGSKYKIEYTQDLMIDAKAAGLNIDKSKSKNEIVWQAYNEHAKSLKDLVVIQYEKLSDPNYLAKKLEFLNCQSKLFESYSTLRGNLIHNQNVLTNQNIIEKNTLLDKIKFYSFFRVNRKIKFSEQDLGDIVSLSEKSNQIGL